MNLTKILRKAGYDLLDSPIRDKKLLQLWRKTPFNEVQLSHSKIDDAFTSNFQLNVIQSMALNIDSSMKNEYGFNIGITILEDLLKSLGLGAIELSAEVKSGKKVIIGYDNSITQEVPIGEIDNYLANADFKHPNIPLLNHLNRNNIIVISGVLFAKNLMVEIETDFLLDGDLIIKLNEIADGKANFEMNTEKKLKMVSNDNNLIPIAVKANRIDFDKGSFIKTTLVTDKGNVF